MKRIIPLFLLAIFAVTSFSCTSDDEVSVDYDTFPVVYDLRNVNFQLVDNVYTIARTMDNPMYETDMMLIYLQVGNTGNGSPIWQQIPINLYLADGNEVDYNFDFSRYDFQIYAGGTFNLAGTSYVNNKTFRIVFIPASYGKGTDNQVDYSNYESVINFYNIDDVNVGTL
ncbi:hypothetical protein [Moheibacter sediminis]|uniref:DUF4352 domain-containing protein n=1 Tax=Moheibacter sediminis TaxID=1434700 RepID=A0A1W2AG76_9FLAO|nr:hypothetical protein [Moheibacter sediminis]SMC59590.1 hypothetical protein SAMN06296427_104130 [Moheibacter sediminis]